jgi:capsular polysaccharide biosynthesis protein
LFVVTVAAAASVYALTTAKRYDATARVVVHPIPASDSTFTGIDVLRASGDTPRDLGTAAHYFDTPEVMRATATRLSLLPSEVSRSLDIRPLAGSNVLLIVGKASTPQLAAQIANGIVQEAIAERTARVQAQVSEILNKLRSASSTEARRRAIDLQALQNRPDPTLETLSAATAPTNPAWPKPVRLIGEATLAAALIAAVFLLLDAIALALPKRVRAPVGDPAMADREQALERRAGAIDQRERELQQVLRDAQKAGDSTSKESALLEKRLAAVSERERALAKDAAQLARRERELADREAVFEAAVAEGHKAPEPAPEPEPIPEPEPEPEPVPEEARSFEVLEGSKQEAEPPPASEAPLTRRPFTIQALEHLVEQRGGQFPDQVEEWRYYIVFLREHAGADGALPASFDYLIEDTFADLL